MLAPNLLNVKVHSHGGEVELMNQHLNDIDKTLTPVHAVPSWSNLGL